MTIVPRTYSEWRHCIEVECSIPLSLPFIRDRIAALSSSTDHYTQQFIRLWGPDHLAQVRQWFEQAANELS
ncbi:hypothetical protein [Stenotrophomonas sp. S41]|uniref:hypothetical protein n=1 Tax=Stenotrophomonas sp. S41 TaxID=2767464 RepID=UPI002D7FE5B8|nr:hypothetical protein [Stenotrophomonas sp. S41]